MTSKSYIAVVDCNNFFVSCERVFRPDLAVRPVIVLSSNDGCVVARSQEVKDIGVLMGIPVFQIKDIIKDKGITLFSSNFTLYRDFSRRVFSVVQAQFEQCEQYSIDEAFVAVAAATESDAVEQAIALKTKIMQLTGIPVSVGIGQTKTQAKFASTKAKREPYGVFFISPTWWQIHTPAISIGDIWGVGRQLRERYRLHQINTVADLLATPAASVQSIGGVVALRLQQELAGTVAYQVDATKKPPQSVISSRSFGAPVTQKSVLIGALAHHIQHGVTALKTQGLLAGIMVIYLEEKHDGNVKRQAIPVPLSRPTRTMSVLLEAMFAVVDQYFEPSLVYRKAGVSFHRLTDSGQQLQPSLFTDESGRQTTAQLVRFEAIDTLVGSLQSRYSNKIVNVGNNTHAVSWQSRSAAISKRYTTSWDELSFVKAQ